MQVSTYVKEALDEVALYSTLAHRPVVVPLTDQTGKPSSAAAIDKEEGGKGAATGSSSSLASASPSLLPQRRQDQTTSGGGGGASPTQTALASEASAFKKGLDFSFSCVFNQPCGYYQLKRFAASWGGGARGGEALKLSLLEDFVEYRLTEDALLRLSR